MNKKDAKAAYRPYGYAIGKKRGSGTPSLDDMSGVPTTADIENEFLKFYMGVSYNK